MDEAKITEVIVNALLPQLKLDVTKPEEAVKKVLDLSKAIEDAYRKTPHNPNIRTL